jgi:hypothetical protein
VNWITTLCRKIISENIPTQERKLGSERRVKTAVILPKSVEKPLHQTCLLHLLLRPARGYPRLGSRSASISRNGDLSASRVWECGRCLRSIRKYGDHEVEPAEWKCASVTTLSS